MRAFPIRAGPLPAALRQELSLAAREGPLGWGSCGGGCSLVVTAHGLWECPPDGPAVRHCWQATELHCSTDTMEVRSDPAIDPTCRHVLEASSRLQHLVLALDSGSRLVDLPFRLPSGTTVRLQARSCRYRGTIVWTSYCHLSPDSDAGSDGLAADALLWQAKEEFGT